MIREPDSTSRGWVWFEALRGSGTPVPTKPNSVLVADTDFFGERVRFISVVPDSRNRFPRARSGELGLEEGWAIAQHGRAVQAEKGSGPKRPIIAIVDLPGQAYGLREEKHGIFLSCAAAADMYASARLAGHPVISLVVGQAASGGFLAHGFQADEILALDDPGVSIHAMGKRAAARVTRRSVEELEALSHKVLPMSYDIGSCAKLGIVSRLIKVSSPQAPTPADLNRVREELRSAIARVRAGTSGGDWTERLAGQPHRAASREVSRRLAEQWADPAGGTAVKTK